MRWPYKTSQSLAEAGYKCRGSVPCPHCDVLVDIYQIPDQMPVFLNPWDYYPHLVTLHNEEAPSAAPATGKDAAAGPDR
jgi:hypothetical protein